MMKQMHPIIKMEEGAEASKMMRLAFKLVRDGLRSGAIPDHSYDQSRIIRAKHVHCGTAQCIAGWIETLLYRAGIEIDMFGDHLYSRGWDTDLFAAHPFRSGRNPTRMEAADAIDRFLGGSSEPWKKESKR